MTIWQLKEAHETKHPNSYFFYQSTLKFFGETLSTMRVLQGTEQITDCTGEKHTCYVLSKLSRNYPGGARRTYAYFDTTTFDHIIPGGNE